MSFPAIFRRLFQKEGAGPLLRKEIIPPHADTHGAQGSDRITPESIGALPASASGGAASADVAVKLKTARAIDGMGFDGTKSIIHYAVCSTAAATAAKTVNLTGFVLEIGARILVRFNTTNTAVNPTLNVNGTGAKAIRYKNATVAASVLAAKSIREFVYDGAYWQIVGDLDSNTTYQPASAAPLAPGTADVGTSLKYAREDHKHPEQTSVSELKTARAIDGVSFDGSAAVTHYATCSTAAATAAKVVSLAGFTLVTGAKVTVRFAVTNTAANPTLNVNKTGAKAIQYRNAAITAGALAANRTYEFVYDGSSWELVGDLDSNTTYGAASTSKAGIVLLSNAVDSPSETQAATSKAVKGAHDKAEEALNMANQSIVGSGKVALKGSRTTTGKWTLTGLTVGKPLFVLGSAPADNRGNSYCYLNAISGTNDGLFGTAQYRFLLGSGAGHCTNPLVVVPTETSVSFDVISFVGKFTVRAYQ